MRRGELSDAQWSLIEGLFPVQKRGGRWKSHRDVFNGILWVLRTGAPWRDLPDHYDKWGSIYHRFNRYRKDGTFDRVLKALALKFSPCHRKSPPPPRGDFGARRVLSGAVERRGRAVSRPRCVEPRGRKHQHGRLPGVRSATLAQDRQRSCAAARRESP